MASLKELQDGLAAADAAGNTADAQAFADAIRSMQAAPQPEAPQGPQREQSYEPFEGFGQGVAKNVISTPGAVSSFFDSIRNTKPTTEVGKWVYENIGPYLNQAVKSSIIGPAVNAPTAEQLLNTFEENVAPFKEMKGPAAYTERIGEMVAPGPGGKANILRNAATTVSAGVGAQGFSDIAKAFGAGERGQSWADLFGAITGTLASRGKKANPVKIAAEGAPTEHQLNTATDAAFDAIKPVSLDKTGYNQTLRDIAAEAKSSGVKKRHSPGLFNDLVSLSKRRNLTMDEVLAIRQEAGREARSFNPANPHQAKAGSIIAKHLDNYFDTAAPQDPTFQQQVKDAGELGRSQSLSRDLKETRRSGDISQMGEAIGEANKVRAYTSSRKGKSFSPVEYQAIKEATGRSMRNPARTIARGLQSYLTQGAGIGASLATANPLPFLTTLGLMGVGRGAEHLIDARTLKKLDDIQAAIRAGRPVQERAVQKASTINKQRNVASTLGILNAIRSNPHRGQE